MEIKETVRDYILEEFLPGTRRSELTDTTPLITGAILDSLSTLRLVGFIEERFAVELAAHEASVEHLDTIAAINALVLSKLGSNRDA